MRGKPQVVPSRRDPHRFLQSLDTPEHIHAVGVEALKGIIDVTDILLYLSDILLYVAKSTVDFCKTILHATFQLVYTALQRLSHPLQMLQDHCI